MVEPEGPLEMSQVYFSTSTLTAGQSVKTTLPTASPDGTGSLAFVFKWFRDWGKASINDLGANVVVSQNGVTLLSVNTVNMQAGPGAGAVVLMPSPSGGAITIQNLGPGTITGVQICDQDDR
jgi:hypothetical protein